MEAFNKALRASLASGCHGIESLAREPALVKASLGLRVGDAKPFLETDGSKLKPLAE